MSNPFVLLSIIPDAANAILDGRKLYEYRRVPPRIMDGTRVVMYVSGTNHAIVGEFISGDPLRLPVERLLDQTIPFTPHPRELIAGYFSGLEVGTALPVRDPLRYEKAIPYAELKMLWPGFLAPQNFRYIYPTEKSAQLYRLLSGLRADTSLQKTLF